MPLQWGGQCSALADVGFAFVEEGNIALQGYELKEHPRQQCAQFGCYCAERGQEYSSRRMDH
jgi:hypothetical protein